MNIKSNHQLWINQYEEIQRSGLLQMGLIPEARAKTYQKVKSSSHSFVEITACTIKKA